MRSRREAVFVSFFATISLNKNKCNHESKFGLSKVIWIDTLALLWEDMDYSRIIFGTIYFPQAPENS